MLMAIESDLASMLLVIKSDLPSLLLVIESGMSLMQLTANLGSSSMLLANTSGFWPDCISKMLVLFLPMSLQPDKLKVVTSTFKLALLDISDLLAVVDLAPSLTSQPVAVLAIWKEPLGVQTLEAFF